MEHACRQEDGGSRFDGVGEMLHVTRSAGGDDLSAARLRHGSNYRQVVSGARAVAGLAGRENDVDAEPVELFGEFHCVRAGGCASAVNIDFVSGREFRVDVYVDGGCNGVDPEFFNQFRNQIGLSERGRGNRNAIGSGVENGGGCFDVANSAANGKRNRRCRSNLFNNVQHGRAIFYRGGNIQQSQLIRSGGAVRLGAFDRVAGVDDVNKMHALDNATVSHVQARHDR